LGGGGSNKRNLRVEYCPPLVNQLLNKVIDSFLVLFQTYLMRYIYFLLIALVMSSCATKIRPEIEFPITSRSVSVELSDIDAQFNVMFSLKKLKKNTVKVSYFPAEDIVCLRYRVDFVTYYQYWYRDSRLAFLSALDRYKVDFETRNLPKKSSSIRAYSTVDSFCIWETAQFTTKGRSFPKIEIGYLFKDNSPYFTIRQKEAVNKDPLTYRDKEKSLNQVLYFTRAQADVLAGLFNQEYLNTVIIGANKTDEESSPYVENY